MQNDNHGSAVTVSKSDMNIEGFNIKLIDTTLILNDYKNNLKLEGFVSGKLQKEYLKDQTKEHILFDYNKENENKDIYIKIINNGVIEVFLTLSFTQIKEIQKELNIVKSYFYNQYINENSDEYKELHVNPGFINYNKDIVSIFSNHSHKVVLSIDLCNALDNPLSISRKELRAFDIILVETDLAKTIYFILHFLTTLLDSVILYVVTD